MFEGSTRAKRYACRCLSERAHVCEMYLFLYYLLAGYGFDLSGEGVGGEVNLSPIRMFPKRQTLGRRTCCTVGSAKTLGLSRM